MKHIKTSEYMLGCKKSIEFIETLSKLKKISHEETLIELYGKKIESIGHLGRFTALSNDFLDGVIDMITFLNGVQNDHFSLVFDGDSDWLMISITWE